MIPKWFCPCVFSMVLFSIAGGLAWLQSDYWLAWFIAGGLFWGITIYLMAQEYYEDKRKEWESE